MSISKGNPLFFIGGPCVIECRDLLFETAEKISGISSKLKIPFIYKASFDKANRSSVDSFRGPGIAEGLKLLTELKEKFSSLTLLIDIHLPEQAERVGRIADIIQIWGNISEKLNLIFYCF